MGLLCHHCADSKPGSPQATQTNPQGLEDRVLDHPSLHPTLSLDVLKTFVTSPYGRFENNNKKIFSYHWKKHPVVQN